MVDLPTGEDLWQQRAALVRELVELERNARGDGSTTEALEGAATLFADEPWATESRARMWAQIRTMVVIECAATGNATSVGHALSLFGPKEDVAQILPSLANISVNLGAAVRRAVEWLRDDPALPPQSTQCVGLAQELLEEGGRERLIAKLRGPAPANGDDT